MEQNSAIKDGFWGTITAAGQTARAVCLRQAEQGGIRMTRHGFMRGMGLGMAAGAVLAASLVPRKKTSLKKAAGKAIKSVGEAVENISDAMDL